MSEPTEGEASQHAELGLSERLGVINALMAQDRTEIRDRQEAVFKLTYYVVPALIGIAAFYVGHPEYRSVLILGQILLFALYVIAFFTFRKWLADSRACLQIRESFYKNPRLLMLDPFEPIRDIEDDDRDKRFEDNALWFPFGVTVVAAIVLVAYMSQAQIRDPCASALMTLSMWAHLG